jgi:dolichol-phosphate mannosyltransferase
MKTLFVIPTYNESENLPNMVDALMALPTDDLDILIVDDNSPDGTGKIADEKAEKYPGRVSVMHRPGKQGLGRAYVEGFGWGLKKGYDAVGEIDADFSHDPKSVPDLIEAVKNGAHLSIGSRYLNGISVINWPLRRIILSLGANEYVRRITGIPIHDGTSGFRLYSREAIEALDLPSVRSNGYSFQVEMTFRAHVCGCKIVEVPIIFTERRAGESKMSGNVIFESAMMPIRLRLQTRKIRKRLGKV